MTDSTATTSTFLSPGKILFGRGSSAELGPLLAETSASASCALLAVDAALVESSQVKDIQRVLAANRIETVLVSDFGPELTVEQVGGASLEARGAGCDVVIGVGGGSVLDAAKVIAVLIGNPDLAPDALDAFGSAPRRSPLVLLPTTCGTGAEVTRVSMISVAGHKKVVVGDILIPDAAILDPGFLDGLPGGVVGSTGMDALAHAVESVMSTTRSQMSQLVAFEAMRVIVSSLRPAHEGDRDARERMQWGSHLAGLALNAGVVIGHSLAYSAARMNPMPHGTSCALALPYAMAYNQRLPDGLGSRVASTLTAGSSSELSDAAATVQDLARGVGQPTNLDEASIPAGSEPAMAQICVNDYPRPNNPEVMELDKIERLVTTMRNGDLTESFAVTANGGN